MDKLHILTARRRRRPETAEELFAGAGIDVVEVERCPDPACVLCRHVAVADAAA